MHIFDASIIRSENFHSKVADFAKRWKYAIKQERKSLITSNLMPKNEPLDGAMVKALQPTRLKSSVTKPERQFYAIVSSGSSASSASFASSACFAIFAIFASSASSAC